MTEATTMTTPASGAASTAALSRRRLLQIGAASGAAAGVATVSGMLVPGLGARGLWSPDGVFGAASIAMADSLYTEAFPTSPLILDPFTDPLPVPAARKPDDPGTMVDRAPDPGVDMQNSMSGKEAQTHQIWPSKIGQTKFPVSYQVEMQVAQHSFTSKKVLPINSSGQPAQSFDSSGKVYPAGTVRDLPKSTIYGFDGNFPGPMINAEYGRAAVVRFCNHLDENPNNYARQDFGTPDYSANIHLHNGHTAPESDGNPNYTMNHFGAVSAENPNRHGYATTTWVDHLYLNWPAGNDDREKQSFFWFHDHRMDYTGSNVYKGLVGLYPIYDPVLDNGDETDKTKLQLPGRRTDHGDGWFDVDYDMPLAFFDCRLDDGVTPHHDMHDAEFGDTANKTHPEWWGMTFFKHFPNHGFVGDVFTVNGVAYPTLKVKRRKYRFRFLDCSIARIYEWKLMTSTKGPVAAKDLGMKDEDLQGQYRLPDGQQAMRFLQVASDGGLMPMVIERNSFELWPAKRREVVIDFTKWQDGTPTVAGKDSVYLVNVMKMKDGRMWSNSTRFSADPNYKVPVLKFEIAEDDFPKDDPRSDKSVVYPGKPLRSLPPIPNLNSLQSMMKDRKVFEVQRGSGGGEVEWLINGKPFDPSVVSESLQNPAGKKPLAQQPMGSEAVWEIRNGGGGWVHPFHLHMEEHRVVMRNGRMMVDNVGKQLADAGHPDDGSREDLAALDPSESVLIYRKFRSFRGKYVAHCHNLAHEDHAMMFGWEIT